LSRGAPLSHGRGVGNRKDERARMTSERREFARLLRKQRTKAEDILWERLRGWRFCGAKFRRQVPFDRFVVDFYCHSAKLVVELDGKQHDWFADYDAERTSVFESRGVSVIRFANAEVEGDLDSVLARIREALRVPFD
jgi:very-short-patch-repair endonuclease